ncbi:hypothetical protein [Pseudarthrobacter sp. MM222]|nr:hypothetical protein [Pseudarthrobacter sp. MM222]CAI3798199.1 hypothetical protein NKCBBBOE_02017 [Pseudarthrobacter sp. MM222]
MRSKLTDANIPADVSTIEALMTSRAPLHTAPDDGLDELNQS